MPTPTSRTETFTHDVFLNHSAEDKAVVRASSLSASTGERAGVRCRRLHWAERLRQDGLNPKAEGRKQKAEILHPWSLLQNPAVGADVRRRGWRSPRKSASLRRRLQPPAGVLQEAPSFFIYPSPCAFGSDWARWEAGTCGRGNLSFRTPLNQERRFLPLRSTMPPSGVLPRHLITATPAAPGFGLCRARILWHSVLHDLRTVARRMEGVARPDSAGTVPAQRGTVRAISGDGRQP